MIVPIIDIFAGPGGLGEGFSSFSANNLEFKIALSIEMDNAAHQTLELRAFFRQFPRRNAPKEYYDYLHGEITKDALYKKYPEEYKAARVEAWNHELKHGDIQQVKERAKTALSKFPTDHCILIGGPPCQAYSVAGRSRLYGVDGETLKRDDRNFLYRHYLRLVAHLSPTIFVMENVKGMLTASTKKGPLFQRILSDLERPGDAVKELDQLQRRPTTKEYDIYSLVVSRDRTNNRGEELGKPLRPQDYIIRSEDYGIPQRRHRVILLGVRKDLDPGIVDRLIPMSKVRVSDVLNDLPPIRSGLTGVSNDQKSWLSAIREGLSSGHFEGTDSLVKQRISNKIREIEANIHPLGRQIFVWPSEQRPKKHVSWYRDKKLGVIRSHEAKKHMKSDLWRYLFASCFAEVHGRSPVIVDYPDKLLPRHRNIDSTKKNEAKFIDRFKVQIAEEASSTVTSHISKDGHFFIHHDPTQCRAWSVREAARIQTFPDNYHFEGNKTEQYHQVGNAVPPLLAYKIAEIVGKYMNKVLST